MYQSYTQLRKTYEAAAEKLLEQKNKLKEQMHLYVEQGMVMQANILAQRMELLTDEYCDLQGVLRCIRSYAEREEAFV